MRQREQAFDINTYYKYKIIKSQKIAKDETQRKENYKALIDYVGPNITKKEIQSSSFLNPINFHPPEYENIPKMYANNKEKPIKFHEKAKVSNIDFSDIQQSKIPIDFSTLMAMFENDEEIAEVDREKLLGIDLEQMGSLKDKTARIIEHLSSYDDDGQIKEKVVEDLEKKIEEIKVIEDDIENIVCNIAKVNKIIYGAEETKIFFKSEKDEKDAKDSKDAKDAKDAKGAKGAKDSKKNKDT